MKQAHKKKLSDLLLCYRVNHKLTQKEMAKLIGCTQSQYSGWENVKFPNKLREELIRGIIK